MHKSPFITFSDLAQIIKKGKKRILISALIFSLIGMVYAITRPTLYEVEATFREKMRDKAESSKSLSAVLLGSGLSSSPENMAISQMKSLQFLEKIVCRLSLNGKIQRKGSSEGIFSRIKNNFLIQQALRDEFPNDEFLYEPRKPAEKFVLPELDQPLAMINLSCLRETPAALKVIFTSAKEFEVQDGNGSFLGKGELGRAFFKDSIGFTLIPVSDEDLSSEIFKITIFPSRSIAKKLRKELKIVSDTVDKTLIRLKYSHRDRRLAAELLNAIMSEYLNVLKDEQNGYAREQLNYLKNRKDEMGQELAQIMEVHATSLLTDLSNTGFLDSKEEIEFLAKFQQEYKKQIDTLDLQIKRLRSIQKSGRLIDQNPISNDQTIQETLVKIRDYKQKSDSLALALSQNEEKGLDQEIQNMEIKNLIASGINLEAATKLYEIYCKESNELEAEMQQHQYLAEQIKDPTFEISSLSAVLKDPVSQGLIAKASQLNLDRKDQYNRSTKEHERIANELAIEREFLAVHLQQTMQLIQLKKNLLKAKIQPIQGTMLELIDQQISLLENYLKNHVQGRIKHFEEEKELIRKHLDELHQKSTNIPKKWVSEQIIKQHVMHNKAILEEVTRMVESKNIIHNISLIQSAPMDFAIAPAIPKPPHIALFSLLGAFLGLIGSFGLLLAQSLYRGLQATSEHLKILGQHVSGELSKRADKETALPLPDHELETLRRLMTFLKGNRILLIEGKGPDYSANLAALLSKQGLKILYLPLMFDRPCKEEELPGILQAIERDGVKPKIQHTPDFDTISSGGISRFGAELVSSPRFQSLLNELKKEYDCILAATDASPSSAEAEGLLNSFDRVAVTVTGERLEELNPYMQFSQDPSRKKISFIFCELPFEGGSYTQITSRIGFWQRESSRD
jgi:hypothetical protein